MVGCTIIVSVAWQTTNGASTPHEVRWTSPGGGFNGAARHPSPVVADCLTLLLDPLASVLLTVLIVVLTVNAVNFVDGLDGLAAGIVGIAAPRSSPTPTC